MSIKEIYDRYINLNLKEYSNINVDFEINKFLIIVLFAIIIATVLINLKRTFITRLLNNLIRHEAFSEDSAKTLAELDLLNPVMKHIISESSQLSRLISRVGEVKMSYEEYLEKIKEKGYKEEKINFDEARFYIKEENLISAKDASANKSSSLLNTVLLCVLTFMVFVCLILLMPEILGIINNLF